MNNVTITVGQNAELKCEVENLNNYKVSKKRNQILEKTTAIENAGLCEFLTIYSAFKFA